MNNHLVFIHQGLNINKKNIYKTLEIFFGGEFSPA